MKVRSALELLDLLDQGFAWRRVELHGHLSLVRSSKGPTGMSLRRGGVALLYAHWEGYAREALTAYWQYVASQRLKYGELAENFVGLGIETELGAGHGRSDRELAVLRARRLLGCETERAQLGSRTIDFRANLGSKAFFTWLVVLGLEDSGFLMQAPLIDQKLLSKRNAIAHGEFLDVGQQDYEELHHEVLSLLSRLRDLVNEAAATQRFRRRSNEQTQETASM